MTHILRSGKPRRQKPRNRHAIEQLEDRCMLAAASINVQDASAPAVNQFNLSIANGRATEIVLTFSAGLNAPGAEAYRSTEILMAFPAAITESWWERSWPMPTRTVML